MASFENIDYRLRPAKAIERKMIAEVIRKLSIFHKIEDYRYIGFGSIYFSDFTLFHKGLGIKNMISIEHETEYEERVKFNLPYSFIEVYHNTSSIILPDLKWDVPSIIWLDYDFPISSIMLDDIATICANAIEGSLLMVTVNVNPFKISNEASKISNFRLKELKVRIGDNKIPLGIEEKHLSQKGFSKVVRQILVNEIQENLKNRSLLTKNVEQKYTFQQLMNFKYEDGATMLTLGGVILKNNQKDLLDKSNFQDLDFLSFDDQEYRIDVPKLTLREVNHLDAKVHEQIISDEDGNIKFNPKFSKKYSKFLKLDDILKYYKIYRYYPNFTESIL